MAAYIHQFGHLPDNFITKKEAKNAGWVSSKGNLSEAAPGKSIGGDRFGNYEGILPEKEGRQYYECDIDSDGGYRGQSGSFTQMTALCITRRITTKLLSFCMERRIHEDSPGRVIYG